MQIFFKNSQPLGPTRSQPRSLRRKAMAALAAREQRDLKELHLGELGWLKGLGLFFFLLAVFDLRMIFI